MSEPFAELSPPYSTIVADPPWEYEQSRIVTTAKTRQTRPESSAQYSTLAAESLCDLPVESIAADDAHLYLWVTNPLLQTGLHLMRPWGFRYVTMLTWRKTGTLGMGYYFRGDTEHVLFGVRGKLPIPPDKRERNWFEAAKTGHSRKPASFYDMVERVSPGPYVDLFCRDPRFGWDSWGYGYEGAA